MDKGIDNKSGGSLSDREKKRRKNFFLKMNDMRMKIMIMEGGIIIGMNSRHILKG